MRSSEKSKLERQRKLLEAVGQHPITIRDAEKIVNSMGKVSRRMVENYLNALKALGLVEYDPEEQLYESTQAKKRVFRSKHDYDLALKHSKNLVLSTNEKQRLDGMDPFLALDLIVFHDDPNREDEDNVYDKCLFQHLITGY